MGINDRHSLVLKISKDDPLLEKKKILMHINGSESEVRIYFSSATCPEWTKITLQAALRYARVIHLNEAELYFGRGDVPLDFYSTRNELESLNSILSVIDTLLSGATSKSKEDLQDLKGATIDLISSLGDKNDEEIRIEKCSCSTVELLLQWGKNNGVKTKLQIAYIEGAGRGAVAMEDLNIGDTALEIPESIIICEELVYETEMFHVLKEIDGISAETMLLLWSMNERYNPDSKFKIYFETLPESFNTGLSFGLDALAALEGTLLFEEIMQAKEHLRTQYDELFPMLCCNHPDIFKPELYTWDKFLWACELWYSNSMKVVFADGKLRTCLVPIAGFLNHSLCPHIMHYGKVDSVTNFLKFPLLLPCREGEQCYLSYGNFSSSHLITFYGFLPKGDNSCDVIPLDINTPEANDSGDCLESDPMHMVRGTWLSSNHDIFYYGLPPQLLDHFRDDKLHKKTYDYLVKEVEILELLQSVFNEMMDGLGEYDYTESDNLNWDVKLALEFKDLQRRIISSVLASCSSGLKMLETELNQIYSKSDKDGLA
ncbi:PREDICTED: uncharacterized protein LOC104599142 [Nelumbo nucifera]|uniref:SET domain-containing protein n=2 Tax=Nelumbo nucifera TaxID=4432 RepID=A0A822YDZ3_NELNU|nr:PREDICTED: uncharacterized protein LOC104599142 [Nelumbo nucifera]DAD27698.1 TPA_asm: hypothetical protein HUJ06_029166 [Nelumbo nucifera]